jgi:hypothetical protein
MRPTSLKLQRGQSMSEFVAAMTFLFIPLFMGVVYIGKYSDIKHQAIQASRYAAMERALDPQSHQSNTVVGNETVARFFRNGANETVAYDEQATEATAGDENPLWGQLNGDAMLAAYSDVQVTLGEPSVDLDPMQAVAEVAKVGFNDLNTHFAVSADVEVPIVNVAHFAPLANIGLTIGAKTVVAGDPWNGGGAQNVADHIGDAAIGRTISLINKIPGVNTLFTYLAGAPAPVMGCVKADIVPTDATATKPAYDPTKTTGINECE